MSYEIQYHPNLCREFKKVKVPRNSIWIKRYFLLAGILLLLFGIRNIDACWDFLIPGETSKTIEAVESLEENLKEGVSLPSAFQTFCFEIISMD